MEVGLSPGHPVTSARAILCLCHPLGSPLLGERRKGRGRTQEVLCAKLGAGGDSDPLGLAGGPLSRIRRPRRVQPQRKLGSGVQLCALEERERAWSRWVPTTCLQAGAVLLPTTHASLASDRPWRWTAPHLKVQAGAEGLSTTDAPQVSVSSSTKA